VAKQTRQRTFVENLTSNWDYLVALDTDKDILRDFSEYLHGNEIPAKPVDWSPLSMDFPGDGAAGGRGHSLP
jgi:hypothetical protein